jgi:hypothetical protein
VKPFYFLAAQSCFWLRTPPSPTQIPFFIFDYFFHQPKLPIQPIRSSWSTLARSSPTVSCEHTSLSAHSAQLPQSSFFSSKQQGAITHHHLPSQSLCVATLSTPRRSLAPIGAEPLTPPFPSLNWHCPCCFPPHNAHLQTALTVGRSSLRLPVYHRLEPI